MLKPLREVMDYPVHTRQFIKSRLKVINCSHYWDNYGEFDAVVKAIEAQGVGNIKVYAQWIIADSRWGNMDVFLARSVAYIENGVWMIDTDNITY